jgi:signal transduction histidine kinase
MRSQFISRILGKREKVDKQTLLDCLLEVAEERDLVSLIVESIMEGVLVVDSHEVLRFANSRAGELLSFNPIDCVLKPIGSFLIVHEILDSIRTCLAQGIPVDTLDVGIYDPKPCVLRFEAIPLQKNNPPNQQPALRKAFPKNSHPSDSSQPAPEGAVLVLLSEVTEERRQQGEQRERRRLAALATLSAGLAHEIRNPLNSMGIHAQLLLRQLRQMEEGGNLLRSVEVIEEEIRSLNEKLTRFLEAARPRRPMFEEVSVHQLFEETLELMQPELVAAGIVPEYYPPDVRTTVFADRTDLRKAFLNILKNSLEAMPEGGQLVIRIQVDAAAVTITVSDTGAGIPDDIIDRIFELGFTTKDVGSGLGLAQVERCIREHYGMVDVQSQPGKGTRFIIRLPVHSQGKRLLTHNPSGPTTSIPPNNENMESIFTINNPIKEQTDFPATDPANPALQP